MKHWTFSVRIVAFLFRWTVQIGCTVQSETCNSRFLMPLCMCEVFLQFKVNAVNIKSSADDCISVNFDADALLNVALLNVECWTCKCYYFHQFDSIIFHVTNKLSVQFVICHAFVQQTVSIIYHILNFSFGRFIIYRKPFALTVSTVRIHFRCEFFLLFSK